MKQNLLIEFSLWLELLALCMEAGLDFMSSLTELTHTYPKSMLSQPFATFLNQVQLGKSKTQALNEFQKNWDEPFMEIFCQTVLHGWQQGISLSPLLKDLAQHIRIQTSFLAEKEIQKNQFKLLLPLFLLILPAVLIVLMMPLFIQLFSEAF